MIYAVIVMLKCLRNKRTRYLITEELLCWQNPTLLRLVMYSTPKIKNYLYRSITLYIYIVIINKIFIQLSVLGLCKSHLYVVECLTTLLTRVANLFMQDNSGDSSSLVPCDEVLCTSLGGLTSSMLYHSRPISQSHG